MKATIKKALNAENRNFFYVYANDKFITALLFEPNQPDEDKWSEKSRFEDAMKLAKHIEANVTFPIEEIVYETK